MLNIRIENLLDNGRIRNKPNTDNPSFTVNDVTKEIAIYDESHSVPHVETPSSAYSLQTTNNSPITSTISETQKLINNIVNEFLFIEVRSPDPSPVPST